MVYRVTRMRKGDISLHIVFEGSTFESVLKIAYDLADNSPDFEVRIERQDEWDFCATSVAKFSEDASGYVTLTFFRSF